MMSAIAKNLTTIRTPDCWKKLAITLLSLAAVLQLSAASRADLTLNITNMTTSSPTAGSFEVDVSNDSGNAVTLSNFSLELTLSGLSGVSFAGASTDTTAAPYIFDGVGGAAYSLLPGNPPFQFSYSSFPTTDVAVSDSDWLSTPPLGGLLPAITIANGATFGLAVTDYSVLTQTSGIAQVNFAAAGTAASDTNFNSVNFDYDSPAAAIIVPTATVPEPSTLALAAIALAAILAACGFSRSGGPAL
jgi:hypothetical protein